MNVRIIDTTVMLNLLDVPNRCSDRNAVMNEFNKAIDSHDTFILPLTTIIETGNTIAQINGNKRHYVAEKFSRCLLKTAEGEAPWSCDSTEISKEDLKYYAENYVNSADSGVGMGDLSIIRTYEKCKDILPIGSIMIWSMDEHLGIYREDEVYKTKRRK